MRLWLVIALLSVIGLHSSEPSIWPDLLKQCEIQSKKDEKAFQAVKLQIETCIHQESKTEQQVISQFFMDNREFLFADPTTQKLDNVRTLCHFLRLMFVVLENKTPAPDKYRAELQKWLDHLVRLNSL